METRRKIIRGRKRHFEGVITASDRHAIKICKFCGSKVTWWFTPDFEMPRKRPRNLNGSPHKCRPEIKVYSKEEIADYIRRSV